ncbi:hypothetical protein B296_00029501 [Ensete ventricosum]|uniref:Uncharacterized protein n=1 Tax=Ensete ventricosum TaxID=4639 RepID=A0A427A193_ENSVE|nr:hypothetical protein B296_00029501 [Ensete ventricosum]
MSPVGNCSLPDALVFILTLLTFLTFLYDSNEEVYAATKAVDLGMVEYDLDNNPIMVDKRKIKRIPALDHSTIDYKHFNKDFCEEQPSFR